MEENTLDLPYSYFINRDLQTGFIRTTGYVDADQIVSAGSAMYSSLEWRPNYNSLWDFRSSRAVDITEEGLKKIVRQKLNRDEEGEAQEKIALLLNRDNLISIAALAEIKADSPSRQIRYFHKEKKAREWLRLPEDADLWAWLEDGQ